MPNEEEHICDCGNDPESECCCPCHRHPEAKAGEKDNGATEILTHLNERVYREFKKHGKTMDASTFAACVGAKMKDCVEEHLRSLIAQSEQRGRLSGINEMASRGREAIKGCTRCPGGWHDEEKSYCSCDTYKPALAALEKVLKDLSQ